MRQVSYHSPVLAETAVDHLITVSDGTYVDCTLGGGGHSELILQRLQSRGKLIAIDADPDAIQFAGDRLKNYTNLKMVRGFFDEIDVLLVEENLIPVHGFLFDLGISSYQIDQRDKGFSFQLEGPLDMRFNPDQKMTAEKVINSYSRGELEEIFRKYGEERFSRAISKRIIEERKSEVIQTTRQLVEIIKKVVPGRVQVKSLARIFQAVRIEVNQELERLKSGLEHAFNCLDKSGRLVVISYHSLEDRIVKEFFRFKEKDCVCPPDFPKCICQKESELRILTKKPLKPGLSEIKENSRSRSAKLRVAEKIVGYTGK
ncbi:MAG: 16S rRNA (cytosine(1402)-N(4))-methyltransferase RsmH [Calditrichia bacterium]|nr:16S rRNA (cytosine(1402)-N(4))-methyltransferase RsmH [Calditrichia bacterium]